MINRNDTSFQKSGNGRTKAEEIFRHCPGCVGVLTGPALMYEIANDAYQELFPGKILAGTPFLQSLPSLAPELVSILRIYNTGETLSVNQVLISDHSGAGDAVSRYLNIIFQARKDTQGIVNGILVFIFDTGSSIQHTKDTEEHYQRFQVMVETSPVAMLVSRGENMVIETANAAMLAIIDKDESILGLPLFTAVPELAAQPVKELFIKTFTTGQICEEIEQPILTKKNGMGVVGYFNITYSPLYTNGAVTGILQTAVDVSSQVNSRKQLKESEENFRLLADNISQLAWMADEMGYVFWYNERWYQYTNTSFNEMKAFGWQNVHHPEHIERLARKFESAIVSGEEWEDTFPLKDSHGNYQWFLSRAVPLKDGEGRIRRWFVTNTDITNQLNLIQQKEDFISIASHELKTPLTTIKGCIQLLQLTLPLPLSEANKTTLIKADLQVNKMMGLIKGFLDVSRFDTGMLHCDLETFDMCALIRDIIEESYLTKNTHVVLFNNTDIVLVEADKIKIEHVITNFLTNAVKYSSTNSEIQINCSIKDGYVIVSVKDNGIGIDSSHMDKVFDRFYRVKNNKTSSSGFGIGLYLCSEIIKLHHGKIWLNSIPDNGSTFYFSLPLQVQ